MNAAVQVAVKALRQAIESLTEAKPDLHAAERGLGMAVKNLTSEDKAEAQLFASELQDLRVRTRVPDDFGIDIADVRERMRALADRLDDADE